MLRVLCQGYNPHCAALPVAIAWLPVWPQAWLNFIDLASFQAYGCRSTEYLDYYPDSIVRVNILDIH